MKNGYKKCSKCGRELHISNYFSNRTRKDGHVYVCKECDSLYRKNLRELHKLEISRYRFMKNILEVAFMILIFLMIVLASICIFYHNSTGIGAMFLFGAIVLYLTYYYEEK